MAEHTPGPWHLHRTSTTRVVAGDFVILLTNTRGAAPSEWQANARLIEAAPEMHAELDPYGLEQVAGILAVAGDAHSSVRHAVLAANLREKARRERLLLARIEGKVE